MTTIHLSTTINAPIKEVFDRSRDIGFHTQSVSNTQEEVIHGIATGLINKEETVTWRGKHFGFWFTHRSLITDLKKPYYFVDEMIEGTFKSFRHEHHFDNVDNQTIMKDKLSYEVPYSILGRLFDYFFLKKYMTQFLKSRNHVIKKSLITP